MSHTHDLGEWAAFLSLGLSISAATSIPFWLFVDASRTDFDPRPLLARAVESGRLDPLLIALGPATYDARHALADRLASRLTAPKGAAR